MCHVSFIYCDLMASILAQLMKYYLHELLCQANCTCLLLFKYIFYHSHDAGYCCIPTTLADHIVEVSKKIKQLTNLAREMKQTEEVENIRSNVNIRKHLDPLTAELVSYNLACV